jgi:hypothetical protein
VWRLCTKVGLCIVILIMVAQELWIQHQPVRSLFDATMIMKKGDCAHNWKSMCGSRELT